MNEEIFVKLRDCFTAGYTLPQYCIDNGIKKPLFVSEKKFELFVWEVYVQFHYDKRMTAQFSFVDADDTPPKYFTTQMGIIPRLRDLKLSEVNLDDFDKIILLTKENINPDPQKVIYFANLERFFIQRTYMEIPLLHFLQRHPDVKLIVSNLPAWVGLFKDGLKFGEQLKTDIEITKLLMKRNGKIETPLDKFGYTNEQVLEIMLDCPKKVNSDGSTILLTENKKILRRIKDGKRTTAYQPEHYKNKIYFFGTCHHYGINAPYDKTIESHLQKILNEHNLPYRVENEGQPYWGRYQDIFYNLNKLNPKPDDIVFIWVYNISSKSLPFCDTFDAFDPPHDFKEVFCDSGHLNELGYKLAAERYFKYLTENNFFRDKEFNYPLPPPRIIVTAFLLGLNRAA